MAKAFHVTPYIESTYVAEDNRLCPFHIQSRDISRTNSIKVSKALEHSIETISGPAFHAHAFRHNTIHCIRIASHGNLKSIISQTCIASCSHSVVLENILVRHAHEITSVRVCLHSVQSNKGCCKSLVVSLSETKRTLHHTNHL